MRGAYAAIFAILLSSANSVSDASEFKAPWRDRDTVIVLDPYHGNDLLYDELSSDKKVVAIIHQATQGLAVDQKYEARRTEARKRNLLWGSYHLLTTDNVEDQIALYLKTVGRHPDETYALDVECVVTGNGLQTDGKPQCDYKPSAVTVQWAMHALDVYNKDTGTYPLLYMNESVTEKLTDALKMDPKYKNVHIWYARFKSDIEGVFPRGIWNTYSLWQFSSELTCTPAPGECTYRVPGTDYRMDVNVFNGTEKQLRQQWPLDKSQ